MTRTNEVKDRQVVLTGHSLKRISERFRLPNDQASRRIVIADIVQALDAGRIAKTSPRCFGITKKMRSSDPSGSRRFVWTENRERCYLLKPTYDTRTQKGFWVVVTALRRMSDG